MPAALGNLIGNAGNKVGQTTPGPSAPSSGISNAPPSMQAGNTGSSIMDKLSGLLGGGNPLQEQNNTYVKGKVDEYMAQQQAAKARAQQKGAQAATRELKRSQQAIPPPQLGTPGSGTTPTSPLMQLWQNAQSALGMK